MCKSVLGLASGIFVKSFPKNAGRHLWQKQINRCSQQLYSKLLWFCHKAKHKQIVSDEQECWCYYVPLLCHYSWKEPPKMVPERQRLLVLILKCRKEVQNEIKSATSHQTKDVTEIKALFEGWRDDSLLWKEREVNNKSKLLMKLVWWTGSLKWRMQLQWMVAETLLNHSLTGEIWF